MGGPNQYSTPDSGKDEGENKATEADAPVADINTQPEPVMVPIVVSPDPVVTGEGEE